VSYRFPRRRLQVALFALVALLAVPGLASAAAGPKLLKPSKNAVIPRNTQPTFSVRDHSSAARKYKVWIIVSSAKKVSHGELKHDSAHGDFSSMKRNSGGRYTYTPALYTFPDYYLQRPGRYWWQSFHIDCSSRARNCHILSKIRSFTVQ
jgi:hypothetical protein